MTDVWFVVPAVTSNEQIRPKYAGQVDGFSGNTVDSGDITTSLGGLIPSNSGVSTWYIVRFYGDSSTLNQIAGNSDTRRLSNSPSKVSQILNNRNNASRTKGDWDNIYGVNRNAESG